MEKLKKILTTIFLAIALILASVFIYETFIRKDDGIDANSKLEELDKKVKDYENEITGYKGEMNKRGNQIDSLQMINNVLIIKNDSLITKVNKSKNKKDEKIHSLDNVHVDELFKLFTEYKPTNI